MGLFSDVRARRRIDAAGALARSGDAAGAVEALAAILTEDPDDVAANVEMARALTLLDDAPGAEQHYRRALTQRLDYSLVVELAQAIAAQSRIDEAEEYLDAALQMTMVDRKLDAGEVHLARAMVCAADGRRDDARQALGQIPASAAAPVKRLAERMADALG